MSLAQYTALLRRCAAQGTIVEARRLHSEIRGHGFDQSTFISNLLMQMYGSLGEAQQARSILGAMESPNEFSWNIMLSIYIRSGQMQQAQQLFAEMPMQNAVASNAMINAHSRLGHLVEASDLFQAAAKRDDITWNTMAAANAQLGHLDTATLFLERIPAWNAVSWNLMITAYARSGNVAQARRVFDDAVVKDVVTWTSMISAYAQNGHSSKALLLFQQMDLEGFQPNKLTITSILNACTSAADLAAGRIIHKEVLTNEWYFQDAGVGNALVNLYGKCGLVDEARRLFEFMPRRDVVSWTAMTAAYAQEGHLQKVSFMFDKMPHRDVISWNCGIAALAQLGAFEDAAALFSTSPHRTSVTWSSIIAANAQHGQFAESLRLYRQMLLEGERPDRITFTVVVEACAALSASLPGSLVHSHVVESGMTLSPELLTGIMHMYARCGNEGAAAALFEQLAPSLDGSDAAPWNVLLTMHARAGLHRLVMELFWKMAQSGHVADEITSVAVLSACSHSGVIQAALDCFQSLVGDFSVIPVVDHYICLLDAFGRAGLLDRAEELVRSMPFEADALVWLAFLAACKMHGDVDRAKRAVDWLVRLDGGDSAPYSLLCGAVAGT